MELLEIVRSDWRNLKSIRKNRQTVEICLAAVTQCGNALKWVKNQTPEICLAAYEANPECIKFMHPGILNYISPSLKNRLEPKEDATIP